MQWVEEAIFNDPVDCLHKNTVIACDYTLPDVCSLWKRPDCIGEDGGNTWAQPVERASLRR